MQPKRRSSHSKDHSKGPKQRPVTVASLNSRDKTLALIDPALVCIRDLFSVESKGVCGE
jgi:hypothetical protein